jgi:RNA-binding motif X-linked protein 2
MSTLRYGEIVDINLKRDDKTGKSKGFAFVAYEDQRSTVLAVDNLNGITVRGLEYVLLLSLVQGS